MTNLGHYIKSIKFDWIVYVNYLELLLILSWRLAIDPFFGPLQVASPGTPLRSRGWHGRLPPCHSGRRCGAEPSGPAENTP